MFVSYFSTFQLTKTIYNTSTQHPDDRRGFGPYISIVNYLPQRSNSSPHSSPPPPSLILILPFLIISYTLPPPIPPLSRFSTPALISPSLPHPFLHQFTSLLFPSLFTSHSFPYPVFLIVITCSCLYSCLSNVTRYNNLALSSGPNYKGRYQLYAFFVINLLRANRNCYLFYT